MRYWYVTPLSLAFKSSAVMTPRDAHRHHRACVPSRVSPVATPDGQAASAPLRAARHVPQPRARPSPSLAADVSTRSCESRLICVREASCPRFKALVMAVLTGSWLAPFKAVHGAIGLAVVVWGRLRGGARVAVVWVGCSRGLLSLCGCMRGRRRRDLIASSGVSSTIISSGAVVVVVVVVSDGRGISSKDGTAVSVSGGGWVAMTVLWWRCVRRDCCAVGRFHHGSGFAG